MNLKTAIERVSKYNTQVNGFDVSYLLSLIFDENKEIVMDMYVLERTKHHKFIQENLLKQVTAQ